MRINERFIVQKSSLLLFRDCQVAAQPNLRKKSNFDALFRLFMLKKPAQC